MNLHSLEWTLLAYALLWLVETVLFVRFLNGLQREGDWPLDDAPPLFVMAALGALTFPMSRLGLLNLWYRIFPPKPVKWSEIVPLSEKPPRR